MKQIFTLLTCCLLLVLLLQPAHAQIQATTDSKHKKEQKRFLKEARKTESAYKETHLNTSTYTFKKGEAGRKRAKKREEARLHKDKTSKKKQASKKKATKTQADG